MTEQPPRLVLETAEAMLSRAYAPYSGYRVGAALWAGEDRCFGGCNVENASYGLTVCAERIAIYHWVAAGKPGEFLSLALCVRDSRGEARDPRPCGACLQVMTEFARDPVLFLMRGESVTSMRLSQLLGQPFTADDLAPGKTDLRERGDP